MSKDPFLTIVPGMSIDIGRYTVRVVSRDEGWRVRLVPPHDGVMPDGAQSGVSLVVEVNTPQELVDTLGRFILFAAAQGGVE